VGLLWLENFRGEEGLLSIGLGATYPGVLGGLLGWRGNVVYKSIPFTRNGNDRGKDRGDTEGSLKSTVLPGVLFAAGVR
jgi:hypothetical protein